VSKVDLQVRLHHYHIDIEVSRVVYSVPFGQHVRMLYLFCTEHIVPPTTRFASEQSKKFHGLCNH
jgi:hypothetical protein